jgi:hypothetical protein
LQQRGRSLWKPYASKNSAGDSASHRDSIAAFDVHGRMIVDDERAADDRSVSNARLADASRQVARMRARDTGSGMRGSVILALEPLNGSKLAFDQRELTRGPLVTLNTIKMRNAIFSCVRLRNENGLACSHSDVAADTLLVHKLAVELGLRCELSWRASWKSGTRSRLRSGMLPGQPLAFQN